MRPIKDRVAIKQDEAQDKTLSGLYIPDSAKEKPLTGIIVAKGPGAHEVEINDKVSYHKYRGAEVEFNGEILIVMREEDVLAII